MSDVISNAPSNAGKVELNTNGKPVGTTVGPEQQKKRLSTFNPKKRHHRSTAAGKGNWRKRFLVALADVPNVAAACEAAGITQPTAYEARKRSQVFDSQWKQALKISVGKLAKAALKRAHDGVVERVWMKDAKGRPVCVDKVRKFSDTLAIFLLKSHAPETYREPPRELGAAVKLPDGTEVKTTFDLGVEEQDVP